MKILHLSGQSNENRRYFNSLDVDDDSTTNSENSIGSYIRTLNTQGAPGAGGATAPLYESLHCKSCKSSY